MIQEGLGKSFCTEEPSVLRVRARTIGSCPYASRNKVSAVLKESRTPSCKGVHPFIAATMLILVTVVLATIVSSFVVNVSSERSKVILNTTQTKLNCQYAGLLVTNVTYDCNSACFTGSPYRINATIENTGSSKIHVSSLFVTLTDGMSYRLDGNSTSFSVGDTTTKLFNSILVYANPKMPTETMDTRNEYANGTNTNLLCHFEATPTCTARTDGAATASGITYESGKFANAVKINETDTLAYNASANINSTQGTIEFWLEPNWSGSDSTRKSLISLRSLDQNVSGQWQFEDKYYNVSSKNITDFSSYGNNGTYVGEAFLNGTIVGANWTTGKYGSALMFNGTDPQTYVEVPDNSALNITSALTVEAWIYVKGNNTHPSNEYIVHKGVNNAPGGGYSINYDYLNNYTTLTVFTNETGTIQAISATNTIQENRWYHVAGTYNRTTLISYIDGIEVARSTGTGIINTSVNPLRIGMRSDYPNVPFNGSIDEVRIYNYALTGEEINASMNSRYPVNRTVASYRFEEGFGSTAYDTHHQVSGRFGAAMSFDGVNDYVSANIAPSAAGNPITYEAWVYPLAYSGYVVGPLYGEPMGVAITSAGNVSVRFFSPNAGGDGSVAYYSSGNMTLNAWHHIAVAWQPNTIKFYIDGSLSGTNATLVNETYPINSILIGYGTAGYGYFNGSIDEVAVYNRSLTNEEINATYHAGLDSGFAKNGNMLVFKWGGNATLFNISSWTANTWSHVAGTWDSSFVRLYTDGNLRSTARTILPSSVNDTLYVGSHWTGEKQVNGWIDELRVSNSSRNFTVTLVANVTQPSTDVVRIYNHANTLMNTSGSMNGVSSYNVSINLSASSEYRIEVTDTSGNTFEKWYPYRTGGACAATSTLDTVKFSTANCPEVTDTYYGSDVAFANCA